MHYIGRRRFCSFPGRAPLPPASGGLAGSWPRAARRPLPRARHCTGSNSSISCRSPTSCCKDKINERVPEGARHQDQSRDHQRRLTSRRASPRRSSPSTGPDIIMAVNNWAQLYADSVVDVSDVAEEIGKAQGGYYETAQAVAYDGKKWIAVPYTILGVLIANRTSWLNEVGYGPDKFPADLGGIPRRPARSSRPRATRSARRWRMPLATRPRFWYPVSVVVGRQGGRGRRQDRRAEQQGDDRIGQIRGRRSGRMLRRGRLAWDDSGNNRAFLAGTISCHQQRRLDLSRWPRSKPDTYQTETGKPIKDDIFHAPLPKGPAGQFS